MSDPKLIGLIDWRNPFCVWVWGLSYCQLHLTDGLIPRVAIPNTAAVRAAAKLVEAHLWSPTKDGFLVHDYLDWNDSREDVLEAREFNRARMALVRNPAMRKALKDRDGDLCRYCGLQVNWFDRKGPKGATYDHLVPHGGDTLENLVVACRSCNSIKGTKSIEQAGLTLRPAPYLGKGSRSNLDSTNSGSGVDLYVQKEDTISQPPNPRTNIDARIVLEPDELMRWFDRIYAAYPNKDRKQVANQAWVELGPDLATAQAILTDIERRKKAGWVRFERRFIPQLVRFLEERQWEDSQGDTGPIYEEDPHAGVPTAWRCSKCGEIHEGTKEQYKNRVCLKAAS